MNSESSNQFTYSGGRSGFFSSSNARSAALKTQTSQWSLEVKDGHLRYLVDNAAVMDIKDAGFREHPFLAFQGLLSQSHIFSNLDVQPVGSDGVVSIAPQVQMLGSKMQGWSGEYSSSSLPQAATDPKLRLGILSATGWQYRRGIGESNNSWKFDNDTLEARKLDKSVTTPNWNCFHYQRPLEHGDLWKYEFWWEPGKSVVMPAIGRAAIHLDGANLEREWLVDKLDGHWMGVEAEKRHAIPNSKQLQLIANAWNQIEIRRDGKDVSIVVNGQQVGLFEIEPHQQSYPGLYVPEGIREFSVRNMTLEGAWPKSLPPNLWE